MQEILEGIQRLYSFPGRHFQLAREGTDQVGKGVVKSVE